MKNYIYDSANRLVQVSNQSTVTSLSYNGLGQRLSMNAAGVIAYYVMDGNRPLTAETSGNVTTFVYGLDAIAEQTTAWNYILPDGSHTPRQLTDSNGEITLSTRYTPWGDTLERNGTGNFAFGYPSIALRAGFGALMDEVTGLLYVGNGQYYDPSTGRFLTHNANPNSPNPYLPFDPTGLLLGPLGGVGIGNGNFTGETCMIDRTPPQVTSIIRAGNNPAINAAADFIVTFSEPVLGVEQNDFYITGSNVIKSAVLALQNVDPFYWVQVLTGAGSGTIRLDLFDNGNITDHAGNPLLNSGYTLGESFTLAKTPVDFPAPSINELPGSLTNNPLSPPSWSFVWNAQAYEIFIARDSGFSQIVLAQTITDTSLLLQSPLADGSYFMRVRAYNPDLNPGKFSKTYAFTLDATPPAPPKLKSPKNGSATPRRPHLQWLAVKDAVRYQIEVDNNADFSSPEFTITTNKTSVQSRALIARTFYWRVRAKDAAENWSEWSVVFSFRVR